MKYGIGLFLPEIQLPALVKIKDRYARKLLWQLFQLRKSQNNQRYTGYDRFLTVKVYADRFSNPSFLHLLARLHTK